LASRDGFDGVAINYSSFMPVCGAQEI
jgi:hypothetical protein